MQQAQPMHPGMVQSTAWSTTNPCAQQWLQPTLQQSVQQPQCSGLQASMPIFPAQSMQQAGYTFQAVQHSSADSGQATGFLGPTVAQQPPLPQLTHALQMMVQSEQQNRQQQQQQQQQGMMQPVLLNSHPQAGAPATAAVTGAGPAGVGGALGLPVSDSLISELQAQLQLRKEAAAATAGSWTNLHPQQQQQQQQSAMMLGELHLLLPALHAKYRVEMQLMLRACQLASSASKHSSATGTTLLMNPSARDQLQRQVLANCNDKHAAVSAAFRQAARAVEAAGGSGKSSSSLPGPQQAAAGAEAGTGAGDGAGCSVTCMAHISQCFQQLRSCYQQELVAATSALFAICRGFGQTYALSPGASASIKAALAAAQQQHGRVEQLWQDVVLAAGDGLS